MVKNIIFMDVLRQEEIRKFYDHHRCAVSRSISSNLTNNEFYFSLDDKLACQMHRQYYKGHPKAYHPLTYFREPQYTWQCPPEMSSVYLSYPAYHIRYKQPTVLAGTTERTSGIPSLPSRTLAARYNKAACRIFER